MRCSWYIESVQESKAGGRLHNYGDLGTVTQKSNLDKENIGKC